MLDQVGAREKIAWPFELSEHKVLLHCCCAVCSGEIVEALLYSGITPSLFFYNPNIDSEDEYRKRKETIITFAKKKDLLIIADDYCPQAWALHTQGLENEPEGGLRCQKCFEHRLEQAAQCALKNGFKVFTSTLGISRYKNFDMVSAYGQKAAQRYPGLSYWSYNWRKKGGSARMYVLAQKEKFYAQNYCGCQFSIAANKK